MLVHQLMSSYFVFDDSNVFRRKCALRYQLGPISNLMEKKQAKTIAALKSKMAQFQWIDGRSLTFWNKKSDDFFICWDNRYKTSFFRRNEKPHTKYKLTTTPFFAVHLCYSFCVFILMTKFTVHLTKSIAVCLTPFDANLLVVFFFLAIQMNNYRNWQVHAALFKQTTWHIVCKSF